MKGSLGTGRGKWMAVRIKGGERISSYDEFWIKGTRWVGVVCGFGREGW